MKLARSFVAILAIAAFTACGDDDGTDPDVVVISDFEGEWTVQTMEYEGDDSDESFDLAAVGLGITELNISETGSFTGTLIFPDQTGTPQVLDIGGAISISGTDEDGGNLQIDFNAQTEGYGLFTDEGGTFTIDGNDLTVVLPEVTFPAGLPGTTAGADADLTIIATS